MRSERSRRGRILSASFVVGFLLSLSAGGLAAQSSQPGPSVLVASTCGWDLPHADTLPRIVSILADALAREPGGYERETATEGLVQLERWIRQCDGTASHNAVLELRRAWQRAPSNPVLEASLGVALARGNEVQPPGAEGHSYRPAYQLSNAELEGRRLLSRVLEKWPIPELGDELAALGIATRNESTLEMAADALRKLTDTLPAAAAVWTARAEVALARREYAEAIETGGKAAELRDPSGFRALGIARMLQDEDPSAGARMYLEGLANADGTALQRYHEDLAPLLLMEEEEQWAGLGGVEARRSWLRNKWEWRASTAGRTVPERLAVHFQRLETVMTKYLRIAHRGARPMDALVADSLYLRFPFDDRGLIYVRHGEPDVVVRTPFVPSSASKEAWGYYRLNEGRALFEFRKYADWSDFVLGTPFTCDPAFYRTQNAADIIFDYGTGVGVVDPSLGAEATRCFALLKSGRYGDEAPYFRMAEAVRRLDARRNIRGVLGTETALPHLEHPIQVLASTYAFRGADGRADVAAFLLIPPDQLTPRPLEQGVAYPLRLSLAVEDPVAGRVQRLDTLLGFAAPRPLGKGLYLRTALQMRVQPVLSATVRITVRNPDHPEEGQILVGTRSVPAFPDAGLSLSDLVIGEPGPGTWRRGGVRISPVPGHQVAVGGKFRLFYEVYGVRPDESIRTRITMAPSTDPDLLSQLKALFKEKRVLELSFEESAQPGPDGVLQVARSITPSLEAGRYTLEVSVERSNGETATAQTRVLLLDRK